MSYGADCRNCGGMDGDHLAGCLENTTIIPERSKTMHKATIQLLEKTINTLSRELERDEQLIAQAVNELDERRINHSGKVARYNALKSDLADAMAMTVRDGARIMGGPMAELVATHGKVDESIERKSRG